jgi:hypothetical protein
MCLEACKSYRTVSCKLHKWSAIVQYISNGSYQLAQDGLCKKQFVPRVMTSSLACGNMAHGISPKATSNLTICKSFSDDIRKHAYPKLANCSSTLNLLTSTLTLIICSQGHSLTGQFGNHVSGKLKVQYSDKLCYISHDCEK